jgi:DNA polymerase III delta prime subunit
MMDAHVIRKEYKQGLNLIDELDRSVGGDPQLDFQRFLYHKLDGDTVTAVKFLQKAAANYPNDNFIQLEMVATTFGEREAKKEAYELMLKSYRDNKLLNQDLLKQYLTSIGENPEPPAKAYKSPTKK